MEANNEYSQPTYQPPVNPTQTTTSTTGTDYNQNNPGTHLYNLEAKGGWRRVLSNLEVCNRFSALQEEEDYESEELQTTTSSPQKKVTFENHMTTITPPPGLQWQRRDRRDPKPKNRFVHPSCKGQCCTSPTVNLPLASQAIEQKVPASPVNPLFHSRADHPLANHPLQEGASG